MTYCVLNESLENLKNRISVGPGNSSNFEQFLPYFYEFWQYFYKFYKNSMEVLKSVFFKKSVEISSTQEICTEFTHIQYIIWVNSVQISWVLEISTAFLKET